MQALPCALQIFRAWTQDTAELIQERPQKLMRLVLATHYPGCRPTPRVTGVDMLSAGPLSAGFGQGGRWGAELEDMFASCMRPAGPGVSPHTLPGCATTSSATNDRPWDAKKRLFSSLLWVCPPQPFDYTSMPFACSVTSLRMHIAFTNAANGQKACADSTYDSTLAAASLNSTHNALSLSFEATVCMLQAEIIMAGQLMCSRCMTQKRCSCLWTMGQWQQQMPLQQILTCLTTQPMTSSCWKRR